jgi:hypothetical protein
MFWKYLIVFIVILIVFRRFIFYNSPKKNIAKEPKKKSITEKLGGEYTDYEEL